MNLNNFRNALEFIMAMVDAVRRITLKIFDKLACGGTQSEFVCADCERWESCGLQPPDTCLIKIEQIRRYEQSRWLRDAPTRRGALSQWDATF